MKAIVAALALAALAAIAFVAEVRRIAAGLDVTPEDGPLEGISWGQSGPHLTFNTGIEQPDDSEVVGMPTMLVHVREVRGNSWTMGPDDIARLWRPYVELPTIRKDWRN